MASGRIRQWRLADHAPYRWRPIQRDPRYGSTRMGDDQTHKWIINDGVRACVRGIPCRAASTIADAFTASSFQETVLVWDGAFRFGAVTSAKGSGE
jgi:hypothetical protein